MLCAPSLGGESFGMVLTEAFAAGTPVIASDIAGYRDVVRDGVDGLLVPAGDAQALAEPLRDLYDEPERRSRMAQRRARTSSASPGRAWPRRCSAPTADAIATPAPAPAPQRAAVRIGARAADLRPHAPARRIASLEPSGRRAATAAMAVVRRVALAGRDARRNRARLARAAEDRGLATSPRR